MVSPIDVPVDSHLQYSLTTTRTRSHKTDSTEIAVAVIGQLDKAIAMTIHGKYIPMSLCSSSKFQGN